jgi:hypothetical protein
MTTIVVLSIVAITLGIDGLLAWRKGFSATISWWVWTNSAKYPVLPFLFGMLAGHFFWDQMFNVTVQGGCDVPTTPHP